MRAPYKALIAGLLMVWMAGAFAQPSALASLKRTSDSLMHALRTEKAQIRQNPLHVRKIVHRILLPNVDLNRMAHTALGNRAWRKASPAQRVRFKRGFTELLVSTYAEALAAYTDETVRFFPLSSRFAGKPYAQVRSLILQRNGPRIPVNYSVVWTGGSWKVYDFSVEGISMVRNFRSQFANELSNGGMDALLARLEAHVNKRS